MIGLCKTELICQQGPWRGLDRVEVATLDWIHWFNTVRRLAPLGDRPPAELAAQYQVAVAPPVRQPAA